MITQYGKSVGSKRAYFADLTTNDDLRDGVNSISNLTNNEDILNIKRLIKSKTPVVAGVYYSDYYDDKEDVVTPNNYKLDGTYSPTCHFIVIIGYGVKKDGSEYFIFYDPQFA